MSSRSINQKAEPAGERVQKVLANTGLASRREIDRLLLAGRIVIDGKTAVPGDRISGSENVLVDGKRIRLPTVAGAQLGAILLYHKPVGEITTRRDAEDRKTVFESLPKAPRGRWIAVGRLDINTSGLLLFTTDGELAHKLMHPSFEIEREYAVRIRGELTAEQVVELESGVQLEDGPAHFERVQFMNTSSANSWYQVRLREGRNREVRRMFEAIGVTVSRLMRIRFGPVDLGRMTRGSSRYLNQQEAQSLYQAVGEAAPASEK